MTSVHQLKRILREAVVNYVVQANYRSNAVNNQNESLAVAPTPLSHKP